MEAKFHAFLGGYAHFSYILLSGTGISSLQVDPSSLIVSSGMAFRFEYTDRVQFAETDMAGIVHFSNFFRYLERAEHAFFRSLDLSIVEDENLGPEERVGWPRVHASCDFHRPLKFQEEFRVELLVEEVRNKSIRYLYRIWNMREELCTEGHIAVVCIRLNQVTKEMNAIQIPERIALKIQAAPEHLLKRPRH